MLYDSLIITGPSGAGKDTLWDAYPLEDKVAFSKIITCTTRDPRANELHGREHYFHSLEDFSRMVAEGQMLEYSNNYGRMYGSTRAEFARIRALGGVPLFKVDVKGAQTLKSKLQSSFVLFIAPPNMDVLRQRLLARGSETEQTLQTRMDAAVQEMKFSPLCQYTLINDDLPLSLHNMGTVLGRAFPDSKRYARSRGVANG